jgi:ATP-dependent RNA helicase SUPV3L1/SUV3
MSEAMLLYQEMKPIPKKATKEEIFSCITCPVDVKSDELVAYWKECCQAFFRREPLPRPVFVDEQTPTLEGSELQYAALDILSRMLKKAREDDNTMQEKMALCEQINDLLLKTKEDYLRRCRSCGAYLPMGFKWNICQRCFKAGNFDRGEDFRRFGRGRRG